MILFGYGYIVRVYYVSTLGRTTIYPFIDFEKDPYTPFKFMFIYGTAWGAVNWMVFKVGFEFRLIPIFNVKHRN